MACQHHLRGTMGVHGFVMKDAHNVPVAFECGPLKLFHSHTCYNPCSVGIVYHYLRDQIIPYKGVLLLGYLDSVGSVQLTQKNNGLSCCLASLKPTNFVRSYKDTSVFLQFFPSASGVFAFVCYLCVRSSRHFYNTLSLCVS